MFRDKCNSGLETANAESALSKSNEISSSAQRIHEVGGTWENIPYNKKMDFFWESAGGQNHRPGLLESNLMVIGCVFYAANDPPSPSELGERAFSSATSSKK